MGYQALYRRYRPARFEDFVGQEAVIKTLRSQITSGRIAHAYLFCGTRGTGKTSTAKVFARAVNCEHPENGDPCGTCDTCRALAEENSLDILEIDAASNNGVDEIRDLREKVKYPPQTGRYRVYIIDEVHMLSQGAFNALLKTLEEPPAYVVFILATTEPQKLPATILSRCQRFDFGRIPAHQIIGRLRVALEEGHIQAEDAALSRIARAAEGGMRDAWSIMDMCLSYAQEEDGGLTEALVLRVLGAADKSFLFAFADRLIDSDAAGALALIDEMMRKGREVQVFVRDVSAHLRALMLADICGEEQLSGLLEVTREDAAEYVAQAKRTSHTRLMRMLDLFLASETDMKWAAQPRFALETAALRACAPEESMQVEALVARVDELERKLRASYYLLGVLLGNLMPAWAESGFSVMLFGMFIAIIIPPARSIRPVLYTVLMAAAISSLFYFTPVLKDLSRGWVIILCAVLVSGLMAWRHPIKTQEEALPVDCGEQKEAQPHE